MEEIGTLELWAWGLCFALQVGVMALLVGRRSYLQFPGFAFYLAGSLAQNVAQFLIYSQWGFTTDNGRAAAWSLQAVMNLLRALAVLELCRQVFGRYPGIWAFIWRTMAGAVGLVALFAITFGDLSLGRRILQADRAMGLAVAVVILLLMLFARYYRVQALEPTKSLAIGFFLYSCFVVLNDTVLERLPIKYFRVWPFLDTVAFTGSVLVWGWALRSFVPQKVAAHQMLPASVYQEMSPQVNERLSALNDRLSNWFKPREPRP
jgi:hypothetical protein